MPSNLRLFRFIFHNLLNLTIAPVLLCCNLSKAFNGNPSLILVQLRFVTAKRNRRCIGGPVSSHQRIFICSKTVVTAVNPISHNPRFHTGLRAVRQSNGFMVGNRIISRMDGASAISMTTRSMPTPRPPVGGSPTSRALTKSISIGCASSSSPDSNCAC